MKIKHLLYSAALLVCIFGILALRPVPSSPDAEYRTHTGVVNEIFHGGSGDISIRVENSDKNFYINRGLDSGLSVEILQQQLLRKEITIEYPLYWTPLDPANKTRHISRILSETTVIYDEHPR